MTAPAVILSLLFGTSIIMTIAMAVAWLHFGRQTHVLTWMAAYAVAVVHWVANAAAFLLAIRWLYMVAGIGLVGSATLIAIGVRQRSGRPLRASLFVIPAVAVMIATAIAVSPMGTPAMQGFITPAYVMILMAISAASLWPTGRRFTSPELTLFALLVCFSVGQAALALAALRITGPDTGKDLYRAILGLYMPAIYVGTGVAAVLVVAGDLAQQLRRQMRHDPLTEVLNRRGMEEAAGQAIAQARRHARPLALVICDLDGFKALNDSHGHIAGDQALQGFARLLTLAVRRGDIVARMGGDEFGLLLHDTDARGAADVMERVRQEVSRLALPRVPAGHLRASFGVADLTAADRHVEDMVARADEALYAAKKDGKNRVSIGRAAA